MMPSGLDVMAALGNDEAVYLLKDELIAFNQQVLQLRGAETVVGSDQEIDDSIQFLKATEIASRVN